ncbi:hypothetical protein L3X37_09620 [Sabulilitoribacter arenilitoris]|uniref:Uncharacterized protein n=1 Tax=Wocania arenilitoris TaxID=2044858 RepID=A0AAE3EQ78_9FLAO|nr:hypothetical protein [Wocania arenilitoris]MCF7568622.1 hypothetical protein [Wocania arenilitoris]
MKKLFFKTILYTILILLALEVLIRVLHLTKDYPSRYIDEFGVEKWVPNQKGMSVTGIRRQNFSEYKINNSGYNSYREFVPTYDKTEIALVGDSFIEGFHQHYYNAIGKKIESKLTDVEVYEFGYAGYDLADQLHLIHAYKSMFNKIDHVILGLKFENDLTRGEYNIIQDRIHLESPLYKNIRKIKLIVHAQNSGVFDPILNIIGSISTFLKPKIKTYTKEKTKEEIKNMHLAYIENFKSLIEKYGFDKQRFVLLIDTSITPQIFIEHLEENNYKYIDFYDALNTSKTPTTLIYDRHWNNHGRHLIANLIVKYYSNIIK